MKKFITFLLIWISQQLAIPFWIVGHIHLSMNLDVYSDVKTLFASLGMNLIVAVGFWLDYKRYSEPKIDHIHNLTKQINENKKSIGIVNNTTNRIVDEISQMKIYK
jgi:hypothetical protein|tara:strand:+ start:110 stop:427 length:318 start_codon:yes stop_codon:yes gene_type:complete